MLQIHLFAQSPALPLTCTHIHHVLATQSTTGYKIDYIGRRLQDEQLTPKYVANKILNWRNRERSVDSRARPYLHTEHRFVLAYFHQVLRFHFINLHIYQHYERQLLQALAESVVSRYIAFTPTEQARFGENVQRSEGKSSVATYHFGSTSSGCSVLYLEGEDIDEIRIKRIVKAATVVLPKHLFARLVTTPPPAVDTAAPSNRSGDALDTSRSFDEPKLSLARYLLFAQDGPSLGDPNSHRGYPLARAVLARHIPLIRLLLDNGASPTEKKYMSVMLAIGRNDLLVVRMLIERGRPEEENAEEEQEGPTERAATALGTSASKKRKSTSSTSSPIRAKRQRVEDRTEVTSAMLELALRKRCDTLVRYFMDKGAVPNLRTLKLLESAGS